MLTAGPAPTRPTVQCIASPASQPALNPATLPPSLPPFPTLHRRSVCSVPYSMEVMKGGALLDSLDLGGRGHWTFGRVPTNDLVLDHPSSSRWV